MSVEMSECGVFINQVTGVVNGVKPEGSQRPFRFLSSRYSTSRIPFAIAASKSPMNVHQLVSVRLR